MKTRGTLPSLIAALAGTTLIMLTGCSKPDDITGMPSETASGSVASKTDQLEETRDEQAADLTRQVKSALMLDPAVRNFYIGVSTLDGTVRLVGVMDEQGQIDHAIRVARNVRGVRDIKNELTAKK